MTGLKDLLKKKDRIAEEASTAPPAAQPAFKFIRTTTESEELLETITPGQTGHGPPSHGKDKRHGEHKRTLAFRHSSNASITRDPTAVARPATPNDATTQQQPRPRADRRLSERLHLGHHHRSRSRSASAESSANLPDDLPAAPDALAAPVAPSVAPTAAEKETQERREAQWEKRATLLAMNNPLLDETSDSATAENKATTPPPPPPRGRSTSSSAGDETLQDAIRLHEAGALAASTAMFGRLADPAGSNVALAQVLYGLALRHGWGTEVDGGRAIRYLSLAASNSAAVEAPALAAGLRTGGAAKAELVLALFELANCFRHGWGVKTDPVAARSYYETAANLGDTDAMEEAAWCYLEGFGGGKDKFKAAQLLRLAEEKGSKSVGNSWIWKDKYTPK